MIEDSLEKVKEAESRADKILEEATHEKEKIIAKAKKEAMDVIEQAEQDAHKDREKLLEKLKKDLEEEKQKKIITTGNQVKKLKNDAKVKISKEVDFLYQKFLEVIS